jgi:ribosomal protein S6--L-glutamate ligase
MKKIGVVGVPDRWSSEHLAQAVADKTGYKLLIDMANVALDLDKGQVRYDGVDLMDLDAIIIKKIASSYSPDVLDRMEILKYLQGKGVPVFSKATSISGLIDRLSCTVQLRLGDIPMPPTVITEDVEHAHAALQEFGAAVFKPLFSTKARGMALIEAGAGARAEIKAFKAEDNPVMYMQRFVRHSGRDLGVTFLGEDYVATYARVGSGDSWDTTTRTGGKYVAVDPDPEIIDLARRAGKLFDMDFTSVDVVETENGAFVYEVSAFGGFRGLLEANGIDAAALYVDYVLDKIS